MVLVTKKEQKIFIKIQKGQPNTLTFGSDKMFREVKVSPNDTISGINPFVRERLCDIISDFAIDIGINDIKDPAINPFYKKDIVKIINCYNEIDSKEKLILTTEKDATRLVLFESYFNGIDIVYLPIKFKFHPKTNFNELILKYVEQNKVNSKISRAENSFQT